MFLFLLALFSVVGALLFAETTGQFIEIISVIAVVYMLLGVLWGLITAYNELKAQRGVRGYLTIVDIIEGVAGAVLLGMFVGPMLAMDDLKTHARNKRLFVVSSSKNK